jgi:glycine betaine/proline transport system substrate-binding protein
MRAPAAALVALVLTGPWGAATASEPDVRIGWTAWADAEVVSKMAFMVLSKMGLDVELTLADVDAQYRGLAESNLDVMLMSWQPETHARYLRKYDGRLQDLGVLYDDVDLGLAVPAYVDDAIQSVDDLADHRDRFDAAIQGIEPSAGVMRLTGKAMDVYGLDDYTLKEATGPAMAQRLERAIEQREPIVVTAWRPHWKWAAFDLRYLDDPQGIYDSKEAVHAVARDGFAEDRPKVAAFLERMEFSLDELQALMAQARERGHREAIRDWLAAHEDRVRSWLQGQ